MIELYGPCIGFMIIPCAGVSGYENFAENFFLLFFGSSI